jgi:hypothetical protein
MSKVRRGGKRASEDDAFFLSDPPYFRKQDEVDGKSRLRTLENDSHPSIPLELRRRLGLPTLLELGCSNVAFPN